MIKLKRKVVQRARFKRARIQFARERKLTKELSPRRERLIFPNGHTIQSMNSLIINKQMQLASALRSNNIAQVKNTISWITRSRECRYWAIYLTISRRGYRSKGIKDLKPTKQEHYKKLEERIWEIIKKPQAYKASPLKKVSIDKPNSTVKRPLSVPTYLDRCLQHLFLIILTVFASADRRSFGFRPFMSPGWAQKAVQLAVWSRKSYGPPKFVYQIDLTKCFERISHKFILENVGNITIRDIKYNIINNLILLQWLKSGKIDIIGHKDDPNNIIPTDNHKVVQYLLLYLI
jgi:RNA-directed DNA polymerase